ncbi:MAG: tetratricopeptide repeat protein [Pyrinomonadaceae bacterium]
MIKKHWKWLLPLFLIASVLYLNTAGGDFVYDDKRQILENPLIQNSDLFFRALTSDVWAFKSDGTIAASNYWRPVFTAESIVAYALFGAEPFGWHLVNILLNAANCVLLMILLLRLNGTPLVSFLLALLFAAHPVHAESVAWIAGVTDLLYSFFFLLSVLMFLRFDSNGDRNAYRVALVCFALAIGSKESALLLIPVYWLVSNPGETEQRKGIRAAIPFAVVGGIFFTARWFVLGMLRQDAPGAAGAGSALMSVPKVFMFYVRQIFIPVSHGPVYSIRGYSEFDFSWLLALAGTVTVLGVLQWVSRRDRRAAFGTALFLLPLLPVLDIRSFNPEQIVSNRYLYLPLAGVVLIFAPYAERLFRLVNKNSLRWLTLGASVVVLGLLGFQSHVVARSWSSEKSIWEYAVKADPESAFAWSQLGSVLSKAGDTKEAMSAYNQALDLKPTRAAYIGRAQTFIREKRYEEAVFDLRTASELETADTDALTIYHGYDLLSYALVAKNEYKPAESAIREARERLPIYYAALTSKLAVVLYLEGEKKEALRELESVRARAGQELLPESKAALMRLGMLYLENGEREKAREALNEYLRQTVSMADEATALDRKKALETISGLSK